MVEAILRDLLNQQLGRYLEVIDKEHLAASLLTGELELKNVKIKPTIFDDTPLPYQLLVGQVGRVYIKLPIWDMLKSPIVVELEDIVGSARIKPLAQWSEAQLVEAHRETTQEILEHFETYMRT